MYNLEQKTDKEDSMNSELNCVPLNEIRHIHLMGICGTGMASLAGILKHKGYHITGSDQNVYPPISLFLEELLITPFEGYKPANLNPRPDLVIVGNVITRQNHEAVALFDLKIPYLSFPQALHHFAFKDKQSIVIAGTHGKTTTSSLTAWIIEAAGFDPGFMIGGIPGNFKKNFKLGNGPHFIIEGDEYDTAFFDKGPKFLHYNPWVVILTSVEFDHADIYRDLEHVISNFKKLIAVIPPEGLLIANIDDPVVSALIEKAKCPVITYGATPKATWRRENVTLDDNGLSRLIIINGAEKRIPLETALYGRHNISNLMAAVALANFLKIPSASLYTAVKSFKGVKRRQEQVGEKKGILVLDDFAHHPTAVQETVAAVKERFPTRRLIAVFEPRSNSSRRNIFQERYALTFDKADLIMIPEPPLMEKIPIAERFSSKGLVAALGSRSLKAEYFASSADLLAKLLKTARSNDVILFMSNGPFDDLPHRLFDSL